MGLSHVQGQAPAQPPAEAPPPRTPPAPATPAKDGQAAPPALPGTPAGTGVLHAPGAPPRDVPLMSIQKDEPRVEVGPVTPETGVADILLGSLGIVAVAVIGSLILGAILGGVLVLLKHRLGWGGPDADADEHISLTER